MNLTAYQTPPTGDWNIWALIGGRGAGKSYAAAQYLYDQMMKYPGLRVGIEGPCLWPLMPLIANDIMDDWRYSLVDGDHRQIVLNNRSMIRTSWDGWFDLLWIDEPKEYYEFNYQAGKAIVTASPNDHCVPALIQLGRDHQNEVRVVQASDHWSALPELVSRYKGTCPGHE